MVRCFNSFYFVKWWWIVIGWLVGWVSSTRSGLCCWRVTNGSDFRRRFYLIEMAARGRYLLKVSRRGMPSVFYGIGMSACIRRVLVVYWSCIGHVKMHWNCISISLSLVLGAVSYVLYYMDDRFIRRTATRRCQLKIFLLVQELFDNLLHRRLFDNLLHRRLFDNLLHRRRAIYDRLLVIVIVTNTIISIELFYSKLKAHHIPQRFITYHKRTALGMLYICYDFSRSKVEGGWKTSNAGGGVNPPFPAP